MTGAFIASLGASTPLGRNAVSTAAAVRAGISAFAEHPYMVDKAGEPMRIARVPWLDLELTGSERFEAMLIPAIDQAVESLHGVGELRTAIALALPEARPGTEPDLSSKLLAALRTRYEGVLSAFAAFPNGHAAGLLALDAACARLSRGALDACVVAGVDSYLAPDTLDWLEESDQFHGAGPLNNAWGFIPGEGAGALLVVRDDVVERFGIPVLAQILSVGTAMECKRIKTETVCIGEGLTAAFRQALQVLPAGEKITDVYCDMNGEPYRADEYGFACLRTKEYFESASDFIAPADCWGDVSAASAPLYIALALIAGSKHYANGATACIWASSEGGHRGAAVLRVRSGAADAR